MQLRFENSEVYMFKYNSPVWQSDVIAHPEVGHAFSTRKGGVSTISHLASMNTGFFRGDDDITVKKNISLLCAYAGIGDRVVGTPQIHSAEIRRVGRENIGEGIDRDVPFPCDGFVTDEPGVSLIVRVADCTPVLLLGIREDGSPVVAALHAGWRGTAAGIAPKGASILRDMGAKRIFAAIGPCIHSCCYAVGEDMKSTVEKLQGKEFADQFITERDGRLYADIASMNLQLLMDAGVEKTDVLNECTACKPELYHSHRATMGVRGTMAAVIGIR